MKRSTRMAAVTLVALLGACAHRPEGAAARQGPAAASFYPLAVGNRWVYEARFLGQTREETVEILKAQEGYFVDSTGAQLSVDGYGLRDQKRYLLREPLEVGRTWTNVVSVSSVEHYQLLEVGQQCEVPAGRFQGCVRVEGRNRVDDKVTLLNELTFAPGVGLVRVRVFATTADGRRIPQTELNLREYHLAQTAPGR